MKQKILTPEEVRLQMPSVLEKVTAPILNGQYHADYNADGAQEYVNYLYTFCGFKKPKKFYTVENPREALYLARDILKDKNFTYTLFYACCVYSAAYWEWHKFVKDNCKPDFEKADELDTFHRLFQDARIFAAVLQEDFVIVSKSALDIKLVNDQLHCEDGMAITFNYQDHPMNDCYFWKGTQVPEKLIMEPESITAKDLAKISNAEMRRCYIEAMGVERYFDKLSGGKGLKIVHEDIDYQGHPMTLYEFDFEGRTVQSLKVIDPSANRVYNIYPTKPCTNVWDAKRSTFNDEKLAYRQGDVGFVEVGKEYEKPLMET